MEPSAESGKSMLRVTRTKAQAKASYDRFSPVYDIFAGAFERKYRDMALKQLNLTAGEVVLEIGFGTGHCLKQMAEAVGPSGKVHGIDISSGMMAVSKRRLEAAGLENRVELTCADAANMPYPNAEFDAVFSSFALELFDSPEIPRVLAEVRRVLRPGGRVGVVSMAKGDGTSVLLRLYEWAHKMLPQFVNCRPIYLEQAVKDAGFRVWQVERVSLLGLPGEIVVGSPL